MNNSVIVRRAAPGDLALAHQAVAEVHGHMPVDDTALASFLADSACYLILAIEGSRVLGSLNGHELKHPHRPDPQFLLYEIDVRPEFRDRGIGRALVLAFAAEARAAGAHQQWVLTNLSNAPAMAVYHACGYRRANPDDVMLEVATESL